MGGAGEPRGASRVTGGGGIKDMEKRFDLGWICSASTEFTDAGAEGGRELGGAFRAVQWA